MIEYKVTPDFRNILEAHRHICQIDIVFDRSPEEFFEILTMESLYALEEYGEEGYKPMSVEEIIDKHDSWQMELQQM